MRIVFDRAPLGGGVSPCPRAFSRWREKNVAVEKVCGMAATA